MYVYTACGQIEGLKELVKLTFSKKILYIENIFSFIGIAKYKKSDESGCIQRKRI